MISFISYMVKIDSYRTFTDSYTVLIHCTLPAHFIFPSQPRSTTMSQREAGATTPFVGLGTGYLQGQGAFDAVCKALRSGYTHFDTAETYKNEERVGEAIRRCGSAQRGSLWTQTKYLGDPCAYGTPGDVLRALQGSLGRLGLSSVQSYLIHLPCGSVWGNGGWIRASTCQRYEEANANRILAWRGMEEAAWRGLTREVGLSNFGVWETAEIVRRARSHLPSVYQGEFHPFYRSDDLVRYLASRGIRNEAYSSTSGVANAAQNGAPPDARAAIGDVARSLNLSHTGLLLRWGLQHGASVWPRSTTAAHLRENLNLEGGPLLPDTAMRTLDSLPQQSRHGQALHHIYNETPFVATRPWPHLEGHWRAAGGGAAGDVTAGGGGLHLDHPDPLAALRRGDVSCVLVRGVLSGEQRRHLMRRLSERNFLPVKGVAENGGGGGGSLRGSVSVVGASPLDVRHSSGGSPYSHSAVTAASKRLDGLFHGASAHGADVNALHVLHRVLDALARRGGKTISTPRGVPPKEEGGTPKDEVAPPNSRIGSLLQAAFGGGGTAGAAATAAVVEAPATPGLLRVVTPGVGTASGLRLSSLYPGAFRRSPASQTPRPYSPTDAGFKPHDHLAAVLCVDAASTTDDDEAAHGVAAWGGEQYGRLYNASLDELLDHVGELQPGVVVADGGRSSSGPVSSAASAASGWAGLGLDDVTHKFLGKRRFASHAPTIRPGDLLIFSSARVHETYNVFDAPRVTLEAELSYSAHNEGGGDLLVWH